MSDTFLFYNNKSAPEYVHKEIEQLTGDAASKAVHFLEPYNMDEPVIMLDYDATIATYGNYAYNQTKKIYYYIENPVLMAGHRMQLRCHIDVLMTFADKILSCSGIIHRNSSLYNKYIEDPALPLSARPSCFSRAFSQQPLAGGNKPLKWYLAIGGSVGDA